MGQNCCSPLVPEVAEVGSRRRRRPVDDDASSSQSTTSFLSSRATEQSSQVFVTPPPNPRPAALTPFSPVPSTTNFHVHEGSHTAPMTLSLRSPSNPSNPGSVLVDGERRKQVVSFTGFAEVVTSRSSREVNMASLLASLPDEDEATAYDGGNGDTASEFMFHGEPDAACNPLSLPFSDPAYERSATESVRSVPIIDAMTPHAAQLATRHF